MAANSPIKTKSLINKPIIVMAKSRKKAQEQPENAVALNATSLQNSGSENQIFDPYNPDHVRQLPQVARRIDMVSNLLYAATQNNKDVTSLPQPVIEVLRPEEKEESLSSFSVVHVELAVELGASKKPYALAKFKRPMIENAQDAAEVEAAICYAIDSILSSFTSLGIMSSLSVVHREWKQKEGRIIKAFPR